MGIGDLPAQLFSPAKMIYVAYLLVVLFDKIEVTLLQFVVASIIFMVLEILHNDYFRIVLNQRATKKSE